MMAAPGVSIVVVSYNTCEMTRRCLASIVGQTRGVDYEIIVVDNGSTDGSADAIVGEFPDVVLVRNAENRGFAAAQNQGLQRARGRYLLILNSDVLFVDNPVKRILDYLSTRPAGVGVVGPQLLNPDGTIATSARRAQHSRAVIALGIVNRHFDLKRWLPREPLLRRHAGALLERWHDNYAQHDTVKNVDFVDGMCLFVRREVLDKVGLFDEQFFFDYEVIDLANRIRRQGWRIEFFPGARVVHVGHVSRRKVTRIVAETHRSELIYHAKYAPENVSVVRWTSLIVVGVRLVLVKALGLLRLRDEGDAQRARVYAEIIEICQSFDGATVWSGERIPSLSGVEL